MKSKGTEIEGNEDVFRKLKIYYRISYYKSLNDL